MKVSEVKSQLAKFDAEGTLSGRNVEVVVDSKKYFVTDLKTSTNKVHFHVTRELFHHFSAKDLFRKLEPLSENAEFSANINEKGDDIIELDGFFISPDFVEIFKS